mmetsp:Transcript_12613/g.30119  ORF Transcript_12613/g.30119 Transcript_12613/m.30119 type:complete len:426 (+) Transcript_12613:100-1377(+)
MLLPNFIMTSTMILFCSSYLTMTMTMGSMVHGFSQQGFGLVGNPSKVSCATKSFQDSTVLTSCSSHTPPFRSISPLWSLRGMNGDNNGSVEPHFDDNNTGAPVPVVESPEEEVYQSLNGGEVSYLMDDTSLESVESVVSEDEDVVQVSLLEENIGDDDMEQVLAAGVVATLGTGNLVSGDVYLDEESGEIKELSASDDEETAPETDHGGVVSGLFGNLRIPASLLAGASLGQAFALPFADADGLTLGMVKRVYVLCMLGSFSSMLKTVLVSTTVMTDITLSNPRLAKSPSDYINRYYALEYMLTKINFFLGSGAFAIGSMLRGWVFLNFAVVGRGVLGIMGSFTLMSASIVLEYSRRQTGKSWVGQLKDTVQLIRNKTKTNLLFGVGAVIWASTLIYLIAKIPHIANYLIATADHIPRWHRLVKQ